MKFGDKLEILRKQKGLSVSEVAQSIGVSENAVAYYEKNVRKPRSKSTVEALAQLLGCTVEELTDDSVDILPESPIAKEPKKEEHAEPVSAEAKPAAPVVSAEAKPAAPVVSSEAKPAAPSVGTEAKPAASAAAAEAKPAAKVTVEKFSVNPDKYFKVGKKKKIRVGKRVAEVSVSDKSIAKIRIKGRKITVKGRKPGTLRITAYGKKGSVLGSWVIHLKACLSPK